LKSLKTGMTDTQFYHALRIKCIIVNGIPHAGTLAPASSRLAARSPEIFSETEA
jgi:hypothetical protein